MEEITFTLHSGYYIVGTKVGNDIHYEIFQNNEIIGEIILESSLSISSTVAFISEYIKNQIL